MRPRCIAHRPPHADAYPRGRTIAVAYDPRDPARSVLEPGTSWRAIAWLVPLLLLTIFWWWLVPRLA